MTFELFDAHAHLQDERLRPEADAVIERAVRTGVRKIVCCGTSEKDWESVRSLAQRHPGVIIPSFGLHPWYIAERSSSWLETLADYLRSLPSAVGEIGLDFAVEGYDSVAQRECFVSQLDLAERLARPVSVHCRKAWDELIGILDTQGTQLPHGGMIHSYSGGTAHIGRLLRPGLYFSFSGSITRSGNKKGIRAVMELPADRLLVETDSPDMAPAGVDGPSEPAHLLNVISSVASIRGVSEKEAACFTAANANRLFGELFV
ncbi:MAG TPA: TatD family hydrolase [bacterium]|nr:TatD family hydrolase [bacterium]